MILTLLISTELAAAQVTEIAGEEDSGHRCEVEEEHTERQTSMHPHSGDFWIIGELNSIFISCIIVSHSGIFWIRGKLNNN